MALPLIEPTQELPILQRRRLAKTGQDQVRELLATIKQLLEVASGLEATNLEAKTAEIQQLIQKYQVCSQDLRATLLGCQELEQQPAPGEAFVVQDPSRWVA
jgi:DNA-binding protein H-NS